MNGSDDLPKPSRPAAARGAETKAREAERRDRLGAALRANLRRRKEAARPQRRPEEPEGDG